MPIWKKMMKPVSVPFEQKVFGETQHYASAGPSIHTHPTSV